ncbi:GNAT family N-acetyltransferase [Veronia pacifica]|uniref:N-acetyltransferase domain-containing protein n=1 Tax=Veronia pacifica TaxID=1080227 RepID=A0A1C3ECG5_9GAMM|nr:GNAT family protein [Veronia pacifica]ODA30921.1 hypothetical protein A8L45_18790 [Veronia pacifica]
MKVPENYIVNTQRCRLRIVSLADTPHILSASRYEGFNDGMQWEPPETERELEAPFYSNIERWKLGTSYSFTIENKPEGRFVGRIAIRQTEKTDIWDIGYWTHPEKQGYGYMKEAISGVLTFGFTVLKAVRIEAGYARWNTASERVLIKNGFTFVQHFPEGFKKRGVWVPVNQMAINDSTWRKAASHNNDMEISR